MKQVKRGDGAVSTVSAVVALILIVLIVAFFIKNYLEDPTISWHGSPIIIRSIANDSTGKDLLVYVQNTEVYAYSRLQFNQSSCLYVNDELVVCAITASNVSEGVATLNVLEGAMLRCVGGAVLPDEKVTVKVETVGGHYWWAKTAYPSKTVYNPPVKLLHI